MTYKKWLLNLIILTIVTMLLLGFLYNTVFLKKAYSPKSYSLSDQDTILISGSSHSASTFNPDLIPGAINVAVEGECYFYTYYKLKYYYQISNKIKHVIISYSPCNIGKNTELKLFGNKDTKHYFDKYFMLLDKEGRSKLSRSFENYAVYQLKYQLGIPFSYDNDIDILYKYFRGTLKLSDFRFSGGFKRYEINSTDVSYIDRKIDFYFYDKGKITDISQFNSEYLEKIAEFCQNKGIKLYLVSTPVYRDYYKNVPESFKKKHQKLGSYLELKYSNVQFLDMVNFQLPETCWLNGDHVNVSGAKIATEYLQENYFKKEVKTN